MPGFVGFTAVENAGVIPIVPGFSFTAETINDELDPNIDENFKLVLKKLTKKDPVTRHKGLLELVELVESADVDVVKAVLPLWPRNYTNLSTDVDHRVREGVQQAQATIATKVGKHIAPYLKVLAGPWIASLFDPHAVAASYATNSFEKSFSTVEKQKNMLLFCEVELLEYFTKNLTVHTPTTVLNPK